MTPRFLFFILILTSVAGCGGGSGNDSVTEAEPEQTGVEEAPAEDIEITSAPVEIKDYLGGLYQTFDWASAVRDPMRDEMEIYSAGTYVEMTQEELTSLNELSSDFDIIAQIGGMGSAKLAPEATEVNPQYATYMDSIIADSGAQWRNDVYNRATEVAAALAGDAVFYWQIGNEINANSYQRNAYLYFDGNTEGLSNEAFGLKVYAEYFLAPTIQALQSAAADTSSPINIALGSIASFSAPSSQSFLDTLLKYEFEGTFAPDLEGKQVHEVINLITIHYLAQSYTADNPENWLEVLDTLHTDWVREHIQGVWVTEEVGINVAESGLGAGAAVTTSARYLQFISQNQIAKGSFRWFYYGTNAGPDGQRISDAMEKLAEVIQNQPITELEVLYYPEAQEMRQFGIGKPGEEQAMLLVVLVVSTDNISFGSFHTTGAALNYVDKGEATYAQSYTKESITTLYPSVTLAEDKLSIYPYHEAISRLESLVIVVE